MNTDETTPLSAREIAGDLLQYMTIKEVEFERLREAVDMVADEFEEEKEDGLTRDCAEFI